MKWNSNKYGTAKFDNIPEEIEICNLGSSHGVHGYYYKDLEEKYTCFNFALDSQGLYYDAKVLETYKDKLAPGCIVIVDISYFQFYGYEDTTSDEFMRYNKRYYRILSPRDIVGYDMYTDIIVDGMVCLDTSPQELLYTLLGEWRTKTDFEKSYPENYSVVNLETLKEDTDASSRRHIWDKKRDGNGIIQYKQSEIKALESIAKICKDNNFMMIMVTVPYLQEYKDAISEIDEKFLMEFEQVMKIKSEELEVDYYDYSSDERFCHDYSLFYNGDHMNSNGARKFTNILYNEVINDLTKFE